MSRTLGLCGFSTAASFLLPPTMRVLDERFPQLQTQTIEAEPGKCFDDLLSGDADVGIGDTQSQELHPVRGIPISGDNSPSRHITAVTRTGADARETVAFALETLSIETKHLMSRLRADLGTEPRVQSAYRTTRKPMFEAEESGVFEERAATR